VTDDRAVRIGIIGGGQWGPNHVRNFAALPDAVVVGLAETSPARRAALARQFRGLTLFADHRSLLDESPDAVVIATPTSTHHAIALAALERGIHVLCEKPLALTAAEAQEMAMVASERGVVLAVGHVFLFNAGIRRLKELLEAGELGRVRYLSARRTNLGPIRSDASCVWDLASHDLAILDYLLDTRPISVSAVGGTFLRPGIEDTAFISLRYPGDTLANVLVSWLDPKKVRELTVVGDHAMVTWDDLAQVGPLAIYDKRVVRKTYSHDFGDFQLMSREGDVRIPRVVMEEPLRAQARAFLEAVRTGEAGPVAGTRGVEVARVLEAIDASMRAGGAPITLATRREAAPAGRLS